MVALLRVCVGGEGFFCNGFVFVGVGFCISLFLTSFTPKKFIAFLVSLFSQNFSFVLFVLFVSSFAYHQTKKATDKKSILVLS